MSEKPFTWTDLYKKIRSEHIDQPLRSKPGKPKSTIPRKRASIYLSEGELRLLREWQEDLKKLLGRKPSYGEVFGILSRAAKERSDGLSQEFESIEDFLEKFVGAD
jgi:hypothetical protein